MDTGELVVMVCGAGPAGDVGTLAGIALERSWTVSIVATANAIPFIDCGTLERLTGWPVRTEHSQAGSRSLREAAALVIAPATFNTINKIANGIADNYPLTLAAELISQVPTTIVPFVNTALATRAPFRHAVDALRSEGVRVLFGAHDEWEPHPPGAGESRRQHFPWHKIADLALDR